MTTKARLYVYGCWYDRPTLIEGVYWMCCGTSSRYAYIYITDASGNYITGAKAYKNKWVRLQGDYAIKVSYTRVAGTSSYADVYIRKLVPVNVSAPIDGIGSIDVLYDGAVYDTITNEDKTLELGLNDNVEFRIKPRCDYDFVDYKQSISSSSQINGNIVKCVINHSGEFSAFLSAKQMITLCCLSSLRGLPRPPPVMCESKVPNPEYLPTSPNGE